MQIFTVPFLKYFYRFEIFQSENIGRKRFSSQGINASSLSRCQFLLCKTGWGLDGLLALTCQEVEEQILISREQETPEIKNSWANGGVFLQEFLWTDTSCPTTMGVWTGVCQRPAERKLKAWPRNPREKERRPGNPLRSLRHCSFFWKRKCQESLVSCLAQIWRKYLGEKVKIIIC